MWDKVISLDLETTGYVAGRHKIIEIGAVSYDPLTETREPFSRLIKIKGLVPPKITELTGITNELLAAEGVPLKEALQDFVEWAQKDGLKPLYVGHNIDDFDLPFINLDLKKAKLKTISERDTWDTLLQIRADITKDKSKTFKAAQQKAKKYRVKIKTNLAEALKWYKIRSLLPHHRGLTDATKSLDIMLKQLAKRRYRAFKSNNKQ